jgi:hypothetical protein
LNQVFAVSSSEGEDPKKSGNLWDDNSIAIPSGPCPLQHTYISSEWPYRNTSLSISISLNVRISMQRCRHQRVYIHPYQHRSRKHRRCSWGAVESLIVTMGTLSLCQPYWRTPTRAREEGRTPCKGVTQVLNVLLFKLARSRQRQCHFMRLELEIESDTSTSRHS